VGTQDSLLDLLFVGAEAYCVTAGRGVGHVDRMLEILAAVQPCRDQPFERLARLVLQRESGLSGVIFVLLAWDDARRSLVTRVRSLGVPALVLLVGAGEAEDAAALGVHRLEPGRIAEGLAAL
jgi:hypothetical protein